MRSSEQQYWDLYAVLMLLDCIGQVGGRPDNLKLQKLTFLHELKGQNEGLRSAHYKFFRYTYGPYSKILAGDVELLETQGFITKTSRQLTKRGRFFLEVLSDRLGESDEIRRAVKLIEDTCREYGKLPSPRLVNRVYAMKVPVFDLGGEIQRVRDIPNFLDILDPIHADLREVQPFGPETQELIKEELSLKADALDPGSGSYKATVQNALDRMRAVIES